MKETITDKVSFWEENKTNIMTYGSIFLFTGVAVTVMLIVLKNKGKRDNLTQSSSGTTSSSSGFCQFGDSFPLRHGSCGKKVETLQKLLQSKGANLGKGGKNDDGVDGKYGTKTQAAVQKYYQVATVTSSMGQTMKIA